MVGRPFIVISFLVYKRTPQFQSLQMRTKMFTLAAEHLLLNVIVIECLQ